jgi:ribonucleoside-diphosphate reductase alpha chain
MLGTSTGIEPYYSFEYFQQSRLGFHKVMIDLAKQYTQPDGSLPPYFAGAMDLGPMEHVRVQAAVQRWTDSSISKTANAPSDFSVSQTKELYEQAYDLGCKGVTIYRDGCRNEQVLTTDAGQEEKNKQSAAGKIDADLNMNAATLNDAIKEASTPEPVEEKVDNPEDYGADMGQKCPQCRTGTMIKLGGCTECSNQCGFKGACDVK